MTIAYHIQTSRPIVHIYDHGDLLLCGKTMTGDRWMIAHSCERKVTCQKCLAVLSRADGARLVEEEE